MSPFLQLALLLAILLFAAKLAGYLSTSLHQPAVLGELLVGLFIGPSVIDIFQIPWFSDQLLENTIHALAEMGVLLLMFVAGLELHLADLARNGKVSLYAGVLGVLIPVLLGAGIGALAGFAPSQSIFLGLTMGATSVSISAQTLMELKALRSRVGMGLLGAAVFDDILVILLLSLFLAFGAEGGSITALAIVFLRMIVFLVISAFFGLLTLPWLVRKISPLPISQGVLTLALVVMFLYGVAAEILGGMAAITGAFLAGLMFARAPEKERLERGMSAISYGLFVPIFFVNIGLSVDLRQTGISALLLLAIITLTAVAGKFIGAGAGARLAGFSWNEAAQLGAGMVSRGEVGLILASVGVKEGLLHPDHFSAIVGMVLISTLITPPLLRYLFHRPQLSE